MSGTRKYIPLRLVSPKTHSGRNAFYSFRASLDGRNKAMEPAVRISPRPYHLVVLHRTLQLSSSEQAFNESGNLCACISPHLRCLRHLSIVRLRASSEGESRSVMLHSAERWKRNRFDYNLEADGAVSAARLAVPVERKSYTSVRLASARKKHNPVDPRLRFLQTEKGVAR